MRKRFTSEEISSMILIKMKEITKSLINKTISNEVITYPTYFNES